MSVSRDGNAEASTSRAHLIPPSLHSMAAGAGAGLVSSIVTCPLDVVKTRLQAQYLARDAKGYEGVEATCKRIWRQAGVKGFYRGLGPTIAGYLPTWGIYFSIYDLVKDRLGGWVENGGESEFRV
jgi:solute carrier family 25 folate transporter 32